MILGIAAGMCWMDALNLHSGKTRGFDNFLCAYSAGSNRSRQNLFILFNGVLIGLMRKLSQLNPHSNYKSLSGEAAAELTSYKLLQAATAFILAALIVLLIGSPSALQLSRAQQANVKWCEEIAPTSTLFQSGVVVLQVCAIFNTVLITAAWLLVALRCSMTISSSITHRSRIVELHEALELHEKRICELQGTRLENSSAEDLKSLIQLHQRAIELTEAALVSRLQALHRTTVAG
ncbi:hypothetical protein V7S43_000242 [Phytophthora oleae]|uniref:Transmembrane protein n=1 Tax=Phytophthora oleae TaxID=2107226 RepID=A0ABD3G7X0_9STRA